MAKDVPFRAPPQRDGAAAPAPQLCFAALRRGGHLPALPGAPRGPRGCGGGLRDAGLPKGGAGGEGEDVARGPRAAGRDHLKGLIGYMSLTLRSDRGF